MASEPTMPASVQVGPYTLDVLVDAAEIAAAGLNDKREILGRCETDHGRILLSPNQSAVSTRETLLHEVVHAVWLVVGLAEHKPDEDNFEEAVVASLSPTLLDTLRRNPALVAYLTT